MKIVKKNLLKIVIFTALKNCCILSGCVFVMVFDLVGNPEGKFLFRQGSLVQYMYQ